MHIRAAETAYLATQLALTANITVSYTGQCSDSDLHNGPSLHTAARLSATRYE